MKKKRILVLVREGLEPPDSIDGMSNDEVYVAPWKTEYDVVVTLRELGYQVRVFHRVRPGCDSREACKCKLLLRTISKRMYLK